MQKADCSILKRLLIGMALIMVATLPLSALAQTINLPRIKVQNGLFIENGSGKEFTPTGTNYFRSISTATGFAHAALCQGTYDRGYVEAMLADLASSGFNTLRVFHSSVTGGDGLLVSPKAREIAPGYTANMLHLLRQARQHKIRIIFTWDIWLPNSEWLSSQPLPNESSYNIPLKAVAGMEVNGFRFSLEGIRNRANSIVELIKEIKRDDPGLLSVVLAWELENEIYFRMDQTPFNMGAGSFTFNGKQYTMGVGADMQALMDDSIIIWSTLCAGAIRVADPEALVSAGVFSFKAVDRTGPGADSSSTGNIRCPARLTALLRADLNYLDLHLYAEKYPTIGILQHLEEDLLSVEWKQLSKAAKKAGKPIFAGESGIFAEHYRNLARNEFDNELAVSGYRQLVTRLKELGFAGTLYWFYGNPDNAQIARHPPMKHNPQYGSILVESPRWNAAVLGKEKVATVDSTGSLHGVATEDGSGLESPIISTDKPGNAVAGSLQGSIQVGMKLGLKSGFTAPGEGVKSDGSISFWAKADTMTSDNYLVFATPSSSSTGGFSIRSTANRYIVFQMGGANQTNKTSFPIGVWHHIVLTWNNTKRDAQMYVDGSLAATIKAYPNTVKVGELRIGGYDMTTLNFSSRQFKGKLYDLQLYTKALNRSEIATLYKYPGATLGALDMPIVRAITRTNDALEITYNRNVAALVAGSIFRVEWSNTLATGTWSDAGVTQTVLNDDGTAQTVKVTIPTGYAIPARFARVKITRP
jgi:hypothetical protein